MRHRAVMTSTVARKRPRVAAARPDFVAGFAVIATRALAAFLGLLALFGSSRAASLDGERRLEAHRAVERVHWERRIWPESNPGPKPPLEAVLTDDVLRTRVEDVLRKSSALAELWHRPVGAAELQAEIDRMKQNTQAPGTLDAMFAAVGRDPVLVAEVIARPALVDRLIRSWYASDARYHDGERREAERALAGVATAEDLARIAPRYARTTWTRDAVSTDAVASGSAEPTTSRTRTIEQVTTAAGAFMPRTIALDPTEWRDLVVSLAQRVGNGSRGERGLVLETEEPQSRILGHPAAEPTSEELLAELPVGRVGSLQETDDAFTATVVVSRTDRSVSLGVASWPKTMFDAWWSIERSRHSALPPDLGEEGASLTLGTDSLAAGASALDTPAPTRVSLSSLESKSPGSTLTPSCTDDTWRKTGTGAPSARSLHAGVWVGSPGTELEFAL